MLTTSRHIDTEASQPHSGSAMYFATSASSRDSQSNSVLWLGTALPQAWKVSLGKMRDGTSEPSRNRSQARMASASWPSRPCEKLPFQIAAAWMRG